MRPLLKILFACVAVPLAAHDAGTELDHTLFPEIGTYSAEALRWQGIARLYPGRVLYAQPAWELKSARHEAVRVVTLPEGVTYLRVYRLDEAIPTLREYANEPALLLDLRYTQSPGLGEALLQLNPTVALSARGTLPDDLRGELDRARGDAGRTGRMPIVVLCNGGTAGPFEAVLDALQSAGTIFAVGAPTAGRTGFYEALEGEDTVWVLRGEVLAANGRSLIPDGFIPEIEVALTPPQHYAAYYLFEGGTPLQSLLRRSSDAAFDDDGANSSESQLDPVLQRGVEVIAALQVIQRMPSSQP